MYVGHTEPETSLNEIAFPTRAKKQGESSHLADLQLAVVEHEQGDSSSEVLWLWLRKKLLHPIWNERKRGSSVNDAGDVNENWTTA